MASCEKSLGLPLESRREAEVGVMILLVAAWAFATYHYWGLPPHEKRLEKGSQCERVLQSYKSHETT